MRTNTVKLCAVVTLVLQTFALAQRTEVRVRRGEVVAETASQSVALGAGRKAILSPDEGLSTSVDDPMVDDVMKIHQWVEEEKQAQREQIDETSIQVFRIDDETRFTLAYYLELRNTKSKPRRVCWVRGTSILEEPRYYDLQGRLLPFNVDKITADMGNYAIRFPEPVAPGEKFKYLCVSKLDASGAMWKDGPLWHLQLGCCLPNCLNYFRFILPKSAIFVDSNRQATLTDSVEGKVALTIRNYTGPVGDGTFHIAFLWPDKDGTTLADLPPQYRGLRDQEQEDIVRSGQLAMTGILAGEVFDDQSTPLATVGTLCSAFVRRDKERVLDLMANPLIRGIAAIQYDQFMPDQVAEFVEGFDLVKTPTWPEAPANGYEHPVYLTRKGSLLNDAVIVMVYRDGKWYWGGMSTWITAPENTDEKDETPIAGVTLSKDEAGLDAATYKGLEPGWSMRKWLFLGPIDVPWEGQGYFPDEKTANEFFDIKSLDPGRFEREVTIDGQDYQWHALTSEYIGIDLTQVFEKWYSVAYLWAQVEMEEETTGVLGIGADDAVQVWLNGELLHQNVIGRVLAYHDNVAVTFKKGKNQLVLKVLNYGGPWGFSC
ncbi:MAG: hypothetical protein JW741_17145, partial [Sedimentisphaerales bacterium]|nr:hypothetical protein [Sedimentisphaerales bacterium]